jgi:hypothetical protein
MASLMLISYLSDWYAAKERHQDRGRHWHALVMFHTQVRSRSKAYFDVGGIYPNIKIFSTINSKVDLTKLWQYLNKDHFVKMGPWEGPEAIR